MKPFLFCTLFCILISSSFAEEAKLEALSLEELMDMKVSVATETQKPIREAPSVVTVITEEQIRSMGARDLREILLSVPGLTFGQDVLGNISIIMRGIWAQEGRILLLIDGMEMNERSYGTLTLANHYSADHIKRIEIIRGPGSAIYGGFAELGVINVTTKTGDDLKGMEISSTNSRTNKDMGQSTHNFMIGHKKEDLSFSVKGMYNQANFTDRDYTDANGTKASLSNRHSHSDNEFLQFQSRYKHFYAHYIKDNYRTKNIILWGDLENTPGSRNIRRPVPKEYLTDVYQVGYQADLTDKFNLHTYFSNKIQYPYLQPDTDNEVDYGNSWRRKVQRKVYGLKTQFHPNQNLIINLGSEQSEDLSWSLNRLTHTNTADVFGNNKMRNSRFTNNAIFTQADYSSEMINLTGGVRYDKPSAYNKTIVPRLGATKVFGKAHVKTLYAKAFRAPVMENISLNAQIKPEITTTSEVEFGYAFNSNLAMNINLFQTRVKDIIVYSYNTVTSTEHYNNYPQVRTKGIETEIMYKNNLQELKLNYSYYESASDKAEPFKSSLNASSLIGAPREKYYLSDAFSLSEKFKLTPSFIYLRNLYAYKWDGANFSQRKMNDQFQANIFGNYKNIWFQGLELGAGINNILNNNIFYSQPYVKSGDYKAGQYPGQSREYIVRVGYSKEF